MNAKRGLNWWAANGALCCCSAVFILPFLWLVFTALKPIEQTMAFQWLPKSYQAEIEGEIFEVIKERRVSVDSVIVTIDEGNRKGERLLAPVSNWDGQKQKILIEEQEADQITKVRRKAELEKKVPARWWRVREKFLRKYAEREPRWNCVAENEIKEGVRFWWENFILAVEYLADTDELPLKIGNPTGGLSHPTQRIRLISPQPLALSRYDTLRLRVTLKKGGVFLDLYDEVGTHDVDIDLRKISKSSIKKSDSSTELWLDNVKNVFVSEARLIRHRATFWTYLGNTLIVCLLGCVGTVLSSSLVAYGFARIQWPHRDKIFWVVLATMMVPFPVTMIPLFGVFRELGWVGTLKPLWVPTFFGSAFNIFLLRQFFLAIPQELSDAAKIDGCSEFGIYWRVILPLSRPALAVVALFHFLYAWNDFMGPLIYLTKPSTFTLSLALQFYQSQHGGSEWHLLMAMSVLILLPIILLFFFTQKTFIQGIATSGMKG